MRLADKAIVVTGAAHGIGRAYSERLASEGAQVALLDIDAKRNEEVAEGICKSGGKALAIATDVRDFSRFKSAVDQAAQAFGKLTGIVNNAGMLNVVPITRCNFEDIADAEWDEAFRLNTKSAWYGCKAALPHLRANKGGSIVNIASSTIFRRTTTRAHYVASKSALIGLTRVLSVELGPHFIRVNLVCPGNTLSQEDPSPDTVAQREAIVKQRSLPRVQYPADLVGTIAFLQSNDSEFTTGQTFLVDGGTAFN